MENKTITITKTMTLPVEEQIQVPAYFKGNLNGYLIVLDTNKCLYIDPQTPFNIPKIEIGSSPAIYIDILKMSECPADEALAAFNQVQDLFYGFLNDVKK